MPFWWYFDDISKSVSLNENCLTSILLTSFLKGYVTINPEFLQMMSSGLSNYDHLCVTWWVKGQNKFGGCRGITLESASVCKQKKVRCNLVNKKIKASTSVCKCCEVADEFARFGMRSSCTSNYLFDLGIHVRDTILEVDCIYLDIQWCFFPEILRCIPNSCTLFEPTFQNS